MRIAKRLEYLISSFYGADGIDFDTVKSLPCLASLTVLKGALTSQQIAELKAAKPKIRITER